MLDECSSACLSSNTLEGYAPPHSRHLKGPPGPKGMAGDRLPRPLPVDTTGGSSSSGMGVVLFSSCPAPGRGGTGNLTRH